MNPTMANNFDKDDIKNYTYKDKEYYKIYNRRLYEQRNGKDCKCDICGTVVKYCHIKRHQNTNKCKKIKESNIEPNKLEPLEKRISQLENLLLKHGITDEQEYDEDDNDTLDN